MRAGGGDHHVNIEKGGGGHLLITWPGGGPYRNFDLSNIFFPPHPLYINNDRSLRHSLVNCQLNSVSK